ncbi:nucleoporin nup146 [Fusarium bulbicola]|nr:nucleoporin nup146 [Fusarium bulbicola]
MEIRYSSVNRSPLTFQIKDVVTSTTVTTSVITSTPTSITTSSTSTDSTSTLTLPGSSTISTPSGFVPIFSSRPNSASKKKKRHAIRGAASPPVLKSKRAPKAYPKQVNCLTTVTSWVRSTVIRTATKAQFVTRDPMTTTISTTKTLTSTSWLSTPDALSTSWTTSTVPSTFVTTSTTTTFSTSINTVVVPTYTTTVYAQCVDNTNGFANNIAGSDNTFGIQSATVPYAQGYYQAYSSSAATALACCHGCAALPLCAMSEFNPNNQAGRQCLLIVSSHATCAFGDYTGQAVLGVNGQTIAADAGMFLRNGNCGMFNSHN